MIQVHAARRQAIEALTFERFAAALFFLAVGFAACLMPAQSDTWWQLRAGQEILATGSIPLHDSFTHTVNGGYWPDHEWLSQVIFYALYKAGGVPLLTAVAAAVVTATWVIVWRLTPGRPLVRLGLCALALGPVATEWSLRPQVFTLLLLALTVLLLVRRRYTFLPPLFLLWANLHGGVMLGVIVVTAAAAGGVAAERRILIQPVIVAGLCALMTVVTPLGFSAWTEIPESLERLRAYGVHEWQPPDVRNMVYLPFWLLAAAFVVLLVRSKPWRAPAAQDVLLWVSAALLPLALSSSRNIAALEVVLLPALGGLVAFQFPVRGGSPGRREHSALNAAVLLGAAAAAVLAVGHAWQSEIPRLGWRPIPQEAIAALADCPEQLYNRYDEGGYLIWFVPGRKVFIDSRQDPFPPEFVREHIQVESSGNYEATFRRYSIRCAFTPANSVLMRRLTADNWQPLYKDANWAVLGQ